MTRKISATNARVNFGDVVDRVAPNAPLAVEHKGETDAVVISMEDYDELQSDKSSEPDWWKMAMETRRRFAKQVGDKVFDVEGMSRTMREERTKGLEAGEESGWRELLAETHKRLGKAPGTRAIDIDKLLRTAREARDEQLLDGLR